MSMIVKYEVHVECINTLDHIMDKMKGLGLDLKIKLETWGLKMMILKKGSDMFIDVDVMLKCEKDGKYTYEFGVRDEEGFKKLLEILNRI